MKPEADGRAAAAEGDAGLWTVPNLISVLRIAAIPVFLWVLLGRGDPALAAWMLAVIAFTDYLDGLLARRLGQVSEIGKLLDPLADRLVVFASVAGGLWAGVVPAWLGWPLVARETAVGLATIYVLSKFKLKVRVRWMGKLATGMVFAAVPMYYLASAGVNPDLWRGMGAGLGGAGLLFYLVVTWQYLGDMRRSLRPRTGQPGSGPAVRSERR